MAAHVGDFEVERQGRTLVLVLRTELRELEFERIERTTAVLADLLRASDAQNVVIDLRQTDYFGSTALSLFLTLWKLVRARGGRMAFCNASACEREVLQLTALDSLWPICPSREEALAQVNEGVPVA